MNRSPNFDPNYTVKHDIDLLLISQADAIIAETQKSAGTKLAFMLAFP